MNTVDRNSRRSSGEPHNDQHSPFEKRPTVHALVEYLRRKGRGAECTDDAHCHPEKYEPGMMEELLALRADAEEHPEALREIREVIWAGSSRTHDETTPAHAAELVRALKDGLEDRRDTAAASSPDDVPDLEEEMERLSNVISNLRQSKTGEELEESVHTIEDWFAITLRHSKNNGIPKAMREKIQKELATLRLVRDELYHSLLFPNWTTLRNNELKQKKNGKGKQAAPDHAA